MRPQWKMRAYEIATTWTSSLMRIREFVRPKSEYSRTLTAAIFDVDGVLLSSPHERAWREALGGFADPDRFATAMYEAHVAGKRRYWPVSPGKGSLRHAPKPTLSKAELS